MTDFGNIINWENLQKNSQTFKNNKPFRWAFVEEIFNRTFYEKLYKTYPKFDNAWTEVNMFRRASKHRGFQNKSPKGEQVYDPSLSEEWNILKRYSTTNEFIDNFSKFSGIKVTENIEFAFVMATKGNFQLPHIDFDGKYPNKLQVLFYFNKNWPKGDPGGTYMCESEDESSIIFEPYNLDNSMMIFEETPNSWHGMRYIVKDGVTRQASAMALN